MLNQPLEAEYYACVQVYKVLIYVHRKDKLGLKICALYPIIHIYKPVSPAATIFHCSFALISKSLKLHTWNFTNKMVLIFLSEKSYFMSSEPIFPYHLQVCVAIMQKKWDHKQYSRDCGWPSYAKILGETNFHTQEFHRSGLWVGWRTQSRLGQNPNLYNCCQIMLRWEKIDPYGNTL